MVKRNEGLFMDTITVDKNGLQELFNFITTHVNKESDAITMRAGYERVDGKVIYAVTCSAFTGL